MTDWSNMDYIMLDLEWNQTYVQRALAVQKRIGAHLHGEVIQIGAVKLDDSMNITGSYSIIVKPRFFTKIHKHVRNLTGISQEMIDNGTPLPEASESFRHWCGNNFVLLTWGPDDVPMLRENLAAHNIPSAWLDCDYDLQKIYSRQKENGAQKQRSLECAMETLGVTQTLPAHDALNDAYFTALVARRLDLAAGVRDYGPRGEEYLYDKTYGDSDIGDIGYETVEEALSSPESGADDCPLCHTPPKVLSRLSGGRGNKYRTLCHCDKDGDLFYTVRVSSNFDGTYRLRKTVTIADPAETEAYRQKMEEAAQKRRRRTRRRHRTAGRTEKTAPPASVND